MIVRNPRERPGPEHIINPARATTVISATGQSTLSHDNPCMCITYSAEPESTSIIFSADFCHPLSNKALKHKCWIPYIYMGDFTQGGE